MKRKKENQIPFIFIFLIFSVPVFAEPPRVGVIPFQNLSEDKSVSWIGLSIAKEITLELTKYSKVKVIDTVEVERALSETVLPKGTIPIAVAKKIGASIKASYIVFGDFQKFNEYVKIVAYIFDVDSGRVIDTIKSNGKIDEIFAVQEDIVKRTRLSLASVIQKTPEPAPKPEVKKPAINEDEITRRLMEEQVKGSGINRNVEDEATRKLLEKELSNYTASDWFRKGVALSDDSDQEIFCYKKAIELDPKFADAYYNLGIVYMHRGNTDEARRNFLNYIRYGDDPAKRSQIMAFLQQFGTDYNLTAGGDRELATYWYNKGVQLSNGSDEEIRYYTWSIYADPTFAPSHYNLANVYYQRGMYSQALKEYKLYLQYAPDDPPDIRQRVQEIIDYIEKLGMENR